MDPSNSGDNNANVSCKVQGHPPSKEIRLYIYDSSPTVVSNGDGNVTVEKNTLFTSSFQVAFNFQGMIHIGFYQNGRIVGTEAWMFFDGHANVSLPGFPVVPTNSGILYVRVVVGGRPFIEAVFNLTVVNQKSLPKSSTLPPPTSYDAITMTSSTPTEIATTAQASSSTTAGTQISTNSTSDISSTHTTKPLTNRTVSYTASPWTTSSENGTELSSADSDPAPDANLSVIFGVVFGIIGLLLVVFLLACCRKSSRVKSCWRRIREALKNEKRNGGQQREPGIVSSPADSGTSNAVGSRHQSISTDDGGAELPLPGQLSRRTGQTDGRISLTRDRTQGTATHGKMNTPGVSSSRYFDQSSISEDDAGAERDFQQSASGCGFPCIDEMIQSSESKIMTKIDKRIDGVQDMMEEMEDRLGEKLEHHLGHTGTTRETAV
ncbi:uncharacterized protein [Oscarella lobularis]